MFRGNFLDFIPETSIKMFLPLILVHFFSLVSLSLQISIDKSKSKKILTNFICILKKVNVEGIYVHYVIIFVQSVNPNWSCPYLLYNYFIDKIFF